jgi:hypothetical protein
METFNPQPEILFILPLCTVHQQERKRKRHQIINAPGCIQQRSDVLWVFTKSKGQCANRIMLITTVLQPTSLC